LNESVDNYLKGLFALSGKGSGGVTTNALAEKMETKASSVTDMLKKLNDRGLVKHTKYYGTTLTDKGKKQAVSIVRKHRLWEVFLVEKLGFRWDEVHDIAEELEHVDSPELIQRLDEFLGYPKWDPHGDPIPDKLGKMPPAPKVISSTELVENDWARVVAVEDSSSDFLHYLETNKLMLGTEFQVRKIFTYDLSIQIKLKNKIISLSRQAAQNVLVVKI